jgi:pimeloyl-ACP methyl ester carboxylesterase
VPYADVDGGQLYYEQHGSGPSLLCIQGLALDVSGWNPQVPVWSREYRVTVFDNRDCGRSFYARAGYDIAVLAADVVALADRLGLASFHLLGSSMGGAIAQEVALAHPERVRSLTLCVSYAGNGVWGRERTRLDLAHAARMSDEERAAELMLLNLSESTLEEMGDELGMMVRMVLSYPYRQRGEGYERQLAAAGTHEARDRLGALAMPVHVVGAEQDLMVPVWRSRELARLIPDARLSIIDGAGHAVHLERTAEYNRLVLDFLREVDASLHPAAARGGGP